MSGAIQDLLGRTEKSPQIIMQVNTVRDGSDPDPEQWDFNHEYYVSGGAEFPGRFRWCVTDSEDSDADKANKIRAELAA